ncbi:MAG: DUF3007 family protein [Desertifilum sp.]|nr:DUF3007 family protein [Desertifilum sp.]
MRRIDVLGVGLAVLLGGGLVYGLLQAFGLDSIQSGIWTQALLVGGLAVWILSYLFRVVNHKMTYSQQVQDYKDAVLQKRLEELTPEELAELQAEIEQENQPSSDRDREETSTP